MSYFDQFPRFVENPTASIDAEFNRLARWMKWKPGSVQFKREKNECLQSEAECYWGGPDKLSVLQDLCSELDIAGPPTSITQCKKALSRLHVNLVDLVNARRTGTRVQHFRSKAALRDYTIQEKKFFPKHAAKADGALGALLNLINGNY